MIIRLEQYITHSFLTISDDGHRRIKNTITYNRKIHKFESRNDFDLISTELNTYGDKAAAELFDYLIGARK